MGETRELEKTDFEKGYEEISGGASEEETQEPTITPEFALEYGLKKEMVGKPMSEFGKVFKDTQRIITRLGQEKKSLSDRLAELETKERTKIEEELGDVPDVQDYDNPTGYKKAMTSYLDKREKLILGKVAQKRNEPTPTEQEAQLKAKIQPYLPEGIDVEKAITIFREENDLTEEDIKFYANNIDLFAKSVGQAAKLYKATLDGNLKKGNRDIDIEKDRLSGKGIKPSDLNSSQRKKKEPTTVAGRIAADLEAQQFDD